MSTTGWLVLIGLVILVVVMNLGLWRALKGGQFFADTTTLYKISRTLRYPWHDEEGQFSELARRVENLKEKPSSSDGKNSLG
jgi:FtsZ-interacting cell division protein ZipA